jgi:Mrr restriction endonuclease-like protein
MDMPTIRVSDEVDQEIRRQGGFGDTHDSVLRRLLKIEKKGSAIPSKERAAHGTVTGASVYRPLILKTLLAHSEYKMHAADVINRIGKLMAGKFTPNDTKPTSSGAVRWQNRVQWAREELRRAGHLEGIESAGRGIWKLTKLGVAAAQKLDQTDSC